MQSKIHSHLEQRLLICKNDQCPGKSDIFRIQWGIYGQIENGLFWPIDEDENYCPECDSYGEEA